MKNLKMIPMLLVLFLSFFVTTLSANDGKFIEAMRKNIDMIYKAQTAEEYQAAVNSFERIAGAEKQKWEPKYYAAFGYIMMAIREKDAAKKDSYLDMALQLVESGKKLAPGESELPALEGFAYMIKLTVDPATRGAKYAPIASKSYEQALQLNPDNPRALSLLAQMQYGSAQFFGSSTAEACNTLQQALAKFESYKAESPIAPQWGKAMTEDMKANCK
jgi:hypothetical protein